MTIFKFTPEIIAEIIRRFPNEYTQDIAKSLNCHKATLGKKAKKLNLFKSKEFMDQHNLRLREIAMSMPPGSTTQNQAIGSLRKGYHGFTEVKVSRDHWRLAQHVRWEEKHGAIPSNCVLTCKTSDTFNSDPDNWICRTKKEVMMQNSIHNLPPELVELCQLRARLERVINER